MKPIRLSKDKQFDAFARFTKAAEQNSLTPKKPLKANAVKELIATGASMNVEVGIGDMEKLISKKRDIDLSFHDSYVYALINTTPEIDDRVIKSINEFHGGQYDETVENRKSIADEQPRIRYKTIRRIRFQVDN